MSTRARLVHRLAGRLRLAIPERRGDPVFFKQLSAQLLARPEVSQVRPNMRTGSVLIEHDGDADPMLADLAERGVLEVTLATAANPLALAVPSVPVLRLVSGREINPLFMAGVAFLGIGVIQIARGQIMVPAATAFWYALSVFPQQSPVPEATPFTEGM